MHLASCFGIVAFMYFLGLYLNDSIEPVFACAIGANRVIPITMATERTIREAVRSEPLMGSSLLSVLVMSNPFLCLSKTAGQNGVSKSSIISSIKSLSFE